MPTIKKISELVELASFPANGDQFVIEDVSETLDADKTKRIKASTLFSDILADIASALALASSAVTSLVYKRQGGNSSNWNTPGTTSYTPSTSTKIQTGSTQISFSSESAKNTGVTISGFTNKPMILVSLDYESGDGTSFLYDVKSLYTVSITSSSFQIGVRTNSNQSGTITVFWMAIGE